jgi:hypothetical protein
MITKQIIQDWMDETQKMMVEKYDQLGFRASGGFEQSLENSIQETPGHYHAQILGAHYTYYIEHGRKAGKFPPRNAILEWINQKNIVAEGITKNSLAFLIARKIAREGTRLRPGVVSDVITQAWINKLIKDLGAATVENITSDILNSFK